VIYVLDRDLIRYVKISAAVLAILAAIVVILYLYGFHTTKLPPNSDEVVNITLDRGLLRFAKFAGGVLAIFVTVGLFLYGFDIKQAAKEVRDAAESMRQIRYDVGKAKDEMATDQRESARLLQEAQATARGTRAELEANRKGVEESTRRWNAELTSQRQKVEASQKQIDYLLVQAKRKTASLSRIIAKAQDQSGEAEETPTAKGTSQSFSVLDLAALYNFPTEVDGDGQTIALIELGGGYSDSDLDAHFGGLKLAKPSVTSVSVDGVKNAPGGDADAQVTLDVEVAGAIAPAAHIVVYFAPSTNKGFADAVKKAIGDNRNRPSVLSIGWGWPEVSWTTDAIKQLDEAFQAAAKAGITVVCAAGDGGVTDGVDDGKAHVDFPASSPWVLSCGGTRVTAKNKSISSEVVWNDGSAGGATGGGVSQVFPLPDWQSQVGVPSLEGGHKGRGVPDVAAHASPHLGYLLTVHGQRLVVGGTSAVVPLWAGLVALINHGVGRNVGYINPLLYSKIGPAGVLHSITEGNNGKGSVRGYSAGPGWNACAGWGSPDGKQLLAMFRSQFVAS